MGNSNISLANKYRPRVFEDVLGQEAIVSAIRGKLKAGKLPRTSMYCGAHGSGKTTLARIVAKAVNCENPKDGNPCCECESCKTIDLGSNPDVIELDAASHNKVEDAEKIIKSVEYVPTGRKKVVILDEMHMLTKEAQNKLLKVVEEPPEHVIFIFCTTEENKVLPTILSRCNKFTFKAIGEDDILKNLRKICQNEQIEYEDDALKLISKASAGHARDSISVLEQLSYGKVTTEKAAQALGISKDEEIFFLLQAVLVEDRTQVNKCLDEIILKGNLQQFLRRVVEILCYLCTFDESVQDNETGEFRQMCTDLRAYLTPSLAMEWVELITRTLRDNRGLGLDLATRLCFLSMVKTTSVGQVPVQGTVKMPVQTAAEPKPEAEAMSEQSDGVISDSPEFEVTGLLFEEDEELMGEVSLSSLDENAKKPTEEKEPVPKEESSTEPASVENETEWEEPSCEEEFSDEESYELDAQALSDLFYEPESAPMENAEEPAGVEAPVTEDSPKETAGEEEASGDLVEDDEIPFSIPGGIVRMEKPPKKEKPKATAALLDEAANDLLGFGQIESGVSGASQHPYKECKDVLKKNAKQPVGELNIFKSFMGLFDEN